MADRDAGLLSLNSFLKLSPPLRTEEDRIALVQGLKDETIDVIVSDHKPEDEEQKRLTFAQASTGASGIETLLSLSLELYHNGSVLQTIRSLADEGMTMVIVTHEINFARDVADRIIYMDKGLIAEQGPSSIIENPNSDRLKEFLSSMDEENDN